MNSSNQSRQIQVLEKKIKRLESDIAGTKNSFAFRLGQLLVETAKSPLRKAWLLPVRLIQMVRDRSPSSGGTITPSGKITTPPGAGYTLRNESQYARPGREEHLFRHLEEFSPTRSWKNSSLRIAFIGEDHLKACLDFEADISCLCENAWQGQLREQSPDFLLVQSSLGQTKNDLDEPGLTASSSQLKDILSFCRQKAIPTVFWDTEDSIHVEYFLPIAGLFDHVFAADPDSVSLYSDRLNRPVGLLPPAIQPAMHNPLRPADSGQTGFTVLFDGWSDMLEYPRDFDFLLPLLDKGLHIVESRYGLVANKLDDLPSFRKNIMGCVSYRQLLSAFRLYKILIMPEKTLSSQLFRTWRTLEATACGCTVVANPRQLHPIAKDLVGLADTDNSFAPSIQKLLNNEPGRAQENLVARRKLFSNHTYAHRIRTICQCLNIEHDWLEFPLATAVTPSKRPDLLPAFLEHFQKQKYPNKELILVVNTNDIDLAVIRKQAEKYPDVHVYQVHQEKNIGVCLNLGVSMGHGKYWFKMDDDDFYGQNYMSDMIQLAETADFDIMGKPPAFIYLQKDDTIYLRNQALLNQCRIGNAGISHLCGATFAGRKDRYPGFNENRRACVDTDFVEDSRDMGQTILSCDIWNFIAFRASNKDKHTWRHDDKTITGSASLFCPGQDKDNVLR